ncbi:hypothetical protein MUK42_32512 [Musa troglodytarum]|uniref:Uncharacterized protein n=1 Tax=Musa troglodytarum TaxID=320322 RepID=A0A9E7JWY9_9LILI|nr:hypothetical protein MUK42_32512 [Musa troglodytarum]
MVDVGRGKGWSSTNHKISTFPCHRFDFFSVALLVGEALARAEEEESGDLLIWSRSSCMLSPRVFFFLRNQAFGEVIQVLSVERDERESCRVWQRRTMDGERRESKRPASADGEEDKREEEEMEKFYAVLENIRATRDYLRRRRTQKRMKTEAAKPVWKPRFEMEDFKQEAVVCSSAISATSNPPKEGEGKRNGKEEEEEREEKSSLDLSLSL